MKSVKILFKKDIKTLVDRCLKIAEVIAPIRSPHGDIIFNPLTSPSEMALEQGFENSIIPPKEFFLPQEETLLTYRRDKDGYKLEPSILDEQKSIILGIRPCDVSAILFLDRLFKSDFKDIYYLKKREKTTLISLGCHEPQDTCFCICTDCGPFLTFGFDLQLTDLANKYFVEIGTPKGEKIIRDNKDLFTDVSVADVKNKQDVVESAKNKFKSARAYFSKTIRRVSAEKVDKKIWDELGQRCFSCGGCSHVCPTCSCFDVMDLLGFTEEYDRMRTWDSCMFAGFTIEASGHNPRSEKKDRVCRRYYHKLSYQYVKKNGTHGCVGCGRCIVTCLGDINMPVVVEKIRRS